MLRKHHKGEWVTIRYPAVFGDVLLVRERPRVQSSLAAPLFKQQYQRFMSKIGASPEGAETLRGSEDAVQQIGERRVTTPGHVCRAVECQRRSQRAKRPRSPPPVSRACAAGNSAGRLAAPVSSPTAAAIAARKGMEKRPMSDVLDADRYLGVPSLVQQVLEKFTEALEHRGDEVRGALAHLEADARLPDDHIVKTPADSYHDFPNDHGRTSSDTGHFSHTLGEPAPVHNVDFGHHDLLHHLDTPATYDMHLHH
jgi:hypothetical protein